MKLDVRLFARARDLAGTERVQVEIPHSSTVADLKLALAEQLPGLRPLVPHLLVAVGADYASDATPLTSELEIACFPPVSGG